MSEEKQTPAWVDEAVVSELRAKNPTLDIRAMPTELGTVYYRVPTGAMLDRALQNAAKNPHPRQANEQFAYEVVLHPDAGTLKTWFDRRPLLGPSITAKANTAAYGLLEEEEVKL